MYPITFCRLTNGGLLDGEWISTIVDDQIYLRTREYHDADRYIKVQFSGKEKEYNQTFAKRSEAFLFAKCEDKNETRLPSLEDGYTVLRLMVITMRPREDGLGKLSLLSCSRHHDCGPQLTNTRSSEGVKDLAGGVTSELYIYDTLDKDRFWKVELLPVSKDFLFAAGILGSATEERSGIMSRHAYSVIKVREVKGKRFVLVKYGFLCSEYQSGINQLPQKPMGIGPVHGAMAGKSRQLNG